jgi:hypothetical protein
MNQHSGPWESTPNDWRWVFNVNVLGVANGVMAFDAGELVQVLPAQLVAALLRLRFGSHAVSARVVQPS